MPTISKARVVAGHVAWCSGGAGLCRVLGAPYDRLIFIDFEPDTDGKVRFYSLRSAPDGRGAGDFQHTVGRETTFFFKTDKLIESQLAFYLFAYVDAPNADKVHPLNTSRRFQPRMETRSEPLVLSELEWRRGDQEECAICLSELGDEPEVLSCGHAFHLDCLLPSQQLWNCPDCASNSRLPAAVVSELSYCTEAMHLAYIKCPVCRELVQ